ncbi:MAG: hypothetical protein ABJA60_09880, partial [Nitrosospira sp.]
LFADELTATNIESFTVTSLHEIFLKENHVLRKFSREWIAPLELGWRTHHSRFYRSFFAAHRYAANGVV